MKWFVAVVFMFAVIRTLVGNYRSFIKEPGGIKFIAVLSVSGTMVWAYIWLIMYMFNL